MLLECEKCLNSNFLPFRWKPEKLIRCIVIKIRAHNLPCTFIMSWIKFEVCQNLVLFGKFLVLWIFKNLLLEENNRFFSSHALFLLYMSFCGHISSLRQLSWALPSHRCQPLLCGRTNVTWSLLAGPIFLEILRLFHSYCRDAMISARWDVSEFRPIFWRLNVRPFCELFIVSEKNLALVGFEPHSLWDENFQSTCSTIWTSWPRR